MTSLSTIDAVQSRLVEVGGRTTQDLGLGRIVGQVLAYVYLATEEKSLDDIAERLALSKASVSVAARQLESYGLVQRVWKHGDRRNYYCVVEHFGVALQRGLQVMIRGKIETLARELESAERHLDEGRSDEETGLVGDKVHRARGVCSTALKLLDSPILGLVDQLLTQSSSE